MSIASEVLPTWDAVALAAEVRADVVGARLDAVAARAERSARCAKGKLAQLDARAFAGVMAAYQDCVADLQRLTSYAELAMAAGGDTADAAAALDRCDLAWARLSSTLGFLEPELAALDASAAARHELLAPGGALHHFYRRVSRTAGSHDEVHRVLAALRPSGGAGWQALARRLLSRIRVVTPDGVTSVGSAMPGLYQPDRESRQQAHRDISQALAGELELRAMALSMIVADGQARADLTGTSWLHETLVSDQLSQAEVDALMAAAHAGYPLVHRYFAVKARLLGRPTLDEADRYAPVAVADGEISWSQAVDIVLESFDAVHPRCGSAARELLESGHVDAADRPGKPAAPFTKDVPGDLPWISVNFAGALRHVLLLAHELGHGVHMMMAADLPPLAAATPRVLAETVALFFETVTAARLQRVQRLPAAALALTARSLEDQLVAACRQVAVYRFESQLREHWQAAGQLDADAIGDRWLATQRELYGDSLALSDSCGSWWSCMDALYQAPGSGYAYLYGQFAATALAGQHAELGTGFGERMLDLMAAGGSAAPGELLRRAGVDPLAPETWQGTLAALGERVAALEATTAATTAHQTFPGSAEPGKERIPIEALEGR